MDDSFSTIGRLLDELNEVFRSSGVSMNYVAMRSEASIPDNSSLKVIDGFMEPITKKAMFSLFERYDSLVESIAELIVRIEKDERLSKIDIPDLPEMAHNKEENLERLMVFQYNIATAIRPILDAEKAKLNQSDILNAIEKKRDSISNAYLYRFTDGDISRIQTIINELREQISICSELEDDHRRRLLLRLERLQSEMHKQMSDVDRIWGFIGEAGVLVEKLGQNAKPIVDRIKELTQITWRTQAKAAELPSDAKNPLLDENGDD